MAAGTKLVMTFLDGLNEERNFSFSYAKASASAANIKALAGLIITNGSIFQHVPVTAKSAKLVTTTETGIDISD